MIVALAGCQKSSTFTSAPRPAVVRETTVLGMIAEDEKPQQVNNNGAQRGYDDETHHKPLRCECYDLGCCTCKIFVEVFAKFRELA